MDGHQSQLRRGIMRVRRLLVFLFIWAVCGFAFGQIHRPQTEDSLSRGKFSTSNLPFVDLSQIDRLRAESSATTSERARAERYSQDSHIPLYNPATGKSYVATTTVRLISPDPLPTESADIIAIGTITSASAHISSDGDMVYTTFAFTPDTLLKASGQPLVPMTLERAGGVALYPDGQKRFVGVVDMGIPEAHYRYLLFLKSVGEANSYTIATGYCIKDSSVFALDRFGDSLERQTLAALLAQIRDKLATHK